jgi:hypothetical protein
MAVISSQNAYSVGLGGIYTKSLAYINALAPIPIYSSRFIGSSPNFLPSLSGVLSKVLPTGTGADTKSTYYYKSILNGGSIGNISFDMKYISSGPISSQTRPLYGILWPKGHK